MKSKSTPVRKNLAYSVADIARILNFPESQIKRWLREFKKSQLTVEEVKDAKELSLTLDFHTLIEFYTFYQLREQGVGPSRINKARAVLADVLNTRYPFATANILTDGRNVFFHADIGELIKADPTLQINIQEVVRPFCNRIEFGDDSLASKLYPLGRESAIQLDPKRQGGQPVVGDTEILSKSVFDQFLNGNSVEALANRFDLSEKEVKDVIGFYEKKQSA